LQKIALETSEISEKGCYITNNIQYEIEEDIDVSIMDQIYYPANQELIFDKKEKTLTEIVLVDVTTIEAARSLSESNIAILNFASARNPGGGWLSGAKAQEEDLARCSALGYVLEQVRNSEPNYYSDNHKAINSLYTDGIIYTPNLVFFRDHTSNLVDPYYLSVVTCPAPNLNSLDVANHIIEKILRKRINRILTVFSIHNHETIILGAWGCGVFANNPELVARIFKEELGNFSFKKVIFAIPNKNDTNYKTFKEILGEL
jgi:uncharacterized protein (TIGR02452 family)